MKISQRILILIIFNIIALLGMAGVIYHLGESEQSYYEQSDNILHIKNLLLEKQYIEKLILSNVPEFGNMDRINMELKRYASLLDRDLIENANMFYELDKQLEKREQLVNSILSIHNDYKSRIADYLNLKTFVLNKSDELSRILQNNLSENLELYLALQKIELFFNRMDLRESPPYPAAAYIEEYTTVLNERIPVLKETAAPETLKVSISTLTTSLKQMYELLTELKSFISANREIQMKEIVNLYQLHDEILLINDNLINELQYKIEVRENQESYAILSGILLIILVSISATAYLGRSISRPIEQLRSYVHSIDLSNLKRRSSRPVLEKIKAKGNLEISQLADSYVDLEAELINKMTELEDRSNVLSKELKERKKTERQLKQTEKYLNNIIQSLNSLVITADRDLKLTHTNKLADLISESDEDELFARFPSLLQFEKKIHAVLEDNHSWSGNAVQLVPVKDHYFNICLTPLVGVRNGGIVIRLDDITAIKSIENQLLESQKWETLGVLTSGFAHDFNNVLTGIVTSSSILLHKAEKNYPDLDKSFLECLNIIDRSGNRAAEMIQQLLSLSRSNELNFTSIDLRQSIRNVQSICSNSFDKSVNFELNLPEEEVPVRADNAQIEQIFLNLYINSYHAMTEMRDKKDKQGGTLKISMKQISIDKFSRFIERGCEPGEYVSVAISDTGVGIAEEIKNKIFDPFFTTKDKSKGTGLGLTMVQHIVNQHKGFIDLYSEPGRGTVITLYLPCSSSEISGSREKEQKRELVKGKGTVLVIDDEEVLRVLTESILKDCGYKVMKAEDGFKGVDLYRKKASEIDLIILDMSMPGISGKETFIELKQLNPEVKILLASGFIKDDRIQDLLNLGLEDFIQKPFDFIELSEKASRILSGL